MVVIALGAGGAIYYQIKSSNERAERSRQSIAAMERQRVADAKVEAEKKAAYDAERRKRRAQATTPEARYGLIIADCKAAISADLKDAYFRFGDLTESKLRNYEDMLAVFGGNTTFEFFMRGVDDDPDRVNLDYLDAGIKSVSYVTIISPLGGGDFARVYRCPIDPDGLGATEAHEERRVDLK